MPMKNKQIALDYHSLSTVMDDYSRKIIAWKLCSSMTAEDVKATLDLAILNTGMKADKIIQRYISGELKEYLKDQKILHTRGRPFHPQTQGKIERYHRSMKNVIHLDNYYSPQEPEARISEWVSYYNHYRYHESLGNITPADKYDGRENQIFSERRKIKQRTMKLRRKANGFRIRSVSVA